MEKNSSQVSFSLLKAMAKNFSPQKFSQRKFFTMKILQSMVQHTPHYNCLIVMCIRIRVTKWYTANQWVQCNLQSWLLRAKLHLFSYMSDVEYWWDDCIGQTLHCSHGYSSGHPGRHCRDSGFHHQIQKHVSEREAVVYVLNVWWLSHLCHSNHLYTAWKYRLLQSKLILQQF